MICNSFISGDPLKLYFQIPCVFPARPQIFPVSIYIICEYYIHRTDLADLSSFRKKNVVFFLRQLSQYPLLLESEHLQLELTKYPVFPVFRQHSPCFHNISKFPVFSMREFFLAIFSCFPCAVGTLSYAKLSNKKLETFQENISISCIFRISDNLSKQN